MKTINNIDEKVLEEFCNRKYAGRIDFVVDVKSGRFYPVPKDMEHKDFVPKIYTGSEDFVPSQLRLRKSDEGNTYDLLEVLIGASSYEAENNILHSRRDLVKALDLTWELINRSQIINPATIVRNEILRDFEKREKRRANPGNYGANH